MPDHLLLRLGALMLILKSLSAKTVGDGDTQLSLVESKGQSVSNVIGPTNRKTTTNLGGAVKQMRKQIFHNLKPRRGNHVPTHSSVRTAKAIIKPILFNVHSGNTISIENGNKRNILRSVKIGSSQFALQGVANFNYDDMKSQSIFAKCLEKLTYCQRLAKDSYPIQHYIYPRATLVQNLQNPQHFKQRRGRSHRNSISSQLVAFRQKY